MTGYNFWYIWLVCMSFLTYAYTWPSIKLHSFNFVLTFKSSWCSWPVLDYWPSKTRSLLSVRWWNVQSSGVRWELSDWPSRLSLYLSLAFCVDLSIIPTERRVQQWTRWEPQESSATLSVNRKLSSAIQLVWEKEGNTCCVTISNL